MEVCGIEHSTVPWLEVKVQIQGEKSQLGVALLKKGCWKRHLNPFMGITS